MRKIRTKQKRNEAKYWLPDNVKLIDTNSSFNKETKLLFEDSQYGPFQSTFKHIQRAKDSTHPIRARLKREQTNLIKYGDTNPFKNKEIQQKAKNTTLSKYGVDNVAKLPEIREKVKETVLARFGVENVLSSKEIQDKVRQTNKELYGVENPMYSTEIKQKFQDSIFTKYGVNNVMHDPIIKERQHKASLEVYKTKDILNILPNGKYVTQYCDEMESAPSSQQANRIYNQLGPQAAQTWIDNHKYHKTAPELHAMELFKDFNPEYINKKIREDLKYKPDIKITDNFYIDVDGLHYHSELYKERRYHFNKHLDYKAKGITLLQIRQNELLDKGHILQSMLNVKFGKNITKFMARKLELKEANSIKANEFFEVNHLMGGVTKSKVIGLYNKDELIMAVAYKNYETGLELDRVCTKVNTIVTAGLSRLLAYIIKLENPKKIVSFVDNRYADGHSLLKLGFIKVNDKDTLGFCWTNGRQTFNRRKCKANMDARRLTEAEYARELRWVKLWDAGQSKYVLELNTENIDSSPQIK